MKTQISRDTFTPEQDYSGVYLQQGRMILDADWNELTDIQKARLVDALRDAISGTGGIPGGSPRDGGLKILADPAGSTNVFIRPGTLYVEGVPARINGLKSDKIAINAQTEYPLPLLNPASYSGKSLYLYADVWERSITALEQSALMDAALHGADTATRSQTLLQVKWSPTSTDPRIEDKNPPIGNAPLKLKLRLVDSSGDPCDPCSSQVNVNERIGNYLFRVEVHDYDASSKTLTLKWSRDNGAVACKVDQMPDGFDEGDWVWEYFDDNTEKLLGNHFATGVDANKLRGRLQTNSTTPSNSYPNTYVRQWDGYIKIRLDTYVLSEGRDRGTDLYKGTADDEAHGRVWLDGGVLKINLELMDFELAVSKSGPYYRFVPGDYWLAPVREAEDDSGDYVLGSASAGKEPGGIRHHYLFLGELKADGTLANQDDTYTRRMNFPPLTDIRAGDVGFTDHCAKLYAGATNVQQALDNLCNIDASDIAFTDNCAKLYAGATNVQQALNNLCNIDASDIAFTDNCTKLYAGATNVQQALNNLCSIAADDIAYPLPNCGSSEGKSIKDKLKSDLDPDGNGTLTVQVALDKLLCLLNAGSLPYTVGDCVTEAAVGGRLGLAAEQDTDVASALDKLLCEFTANDLPLDKSDAGLCTDLQVDEAETVQDALKILCNKSGGCAVTVTSAGHLEALLEEFAAGSEASLWLCLKAGTYPITKSIAIAGKTNLRISGQGRESTTVSLGGTALSIDAEEVIIENISFDLNQAKGQIAMTADSSQVSGCRFTRQRAATLSQTPPAMISAGSRGNGAVRILWRDNILYAMLYAPFGLGRDDRRLPVLAPDYALRLENNMVGGILEGNRIDGYLLFGNGIDGFSTPAVGSIKQIRIAGVVAREGENLQLLSNRITAIKANLSTANSDGYLDAQVQANARLVLANNHIEGTANAISAKNIVATGNYWAGGTSDLGYFIADRASLTGNIVEDDANKSKIICTVAETQLVASGNILLQALPMLI